MSQIGNTVYLNTTFPDTVQELPSFTDLSVADQNNYIRYLQQILANNMTGANTYYELITDSAKINANKLNILSDTIGAIQAVYENTSSFTDIINSKQAEWQEIIDKFKVEPAAHIQMAITESTMSGSLTNTTTITLEPWRSNKAYELNYVVYHNGACYKSLVSDNQNIEPPNTQYWERVYKEYTMVNVNTESDIKLGLFGLSKYAGLYMALEDITSDKPYWDSSQWVRLTLKGDKGDNGGSFNFKENWDATVSYVEGDLVVFNEEAYLSLQNNNIGNTPSTSTSWWRREFRTSPQYIPVQSETPTGQEEGDLWFQIV